MTTLSRIPLYSNPYINLNSQPLFGIKPETVKLPTGEVKLPVGFFCYRKTLWEHHIGHALETFKRQHGDDGELTGQYAEEYALYEGIRKEIQQIFVPDTTKKFAEWVAGGRKGEFKFSSDPTEDDYEKAFALYRIIALGGEWHGEKVPALLLSGDLSDDGHKREVRFSSAQLQKEASVDGYFPKMRHPVTIGFGNAVLKRPKNTGDLSNGSTVNRMAYDGYGNRTLALA